MPKLREVIDLPRRLLSPLWLRPDTTLEQESAAEDLVEFVNLREEETGVPGTIYISTEIAGHIPRVKYYAGRAGKTQASVSVSIGSLTGAAGSRPCRPAAATPRLAAVATDVAVSEFLPVRLPGG